jgi:hypothetical protein
MMKGMAEAIPIIDQAWIKVEALRLARNAVKQDIRDRGDRLKNYAAKDITRLAELWRDCHPELIEQATATFLHYRAKLESDAQKRKGMKSVASLVQKLGAK